MRLHLDILSEEEKKLIHEESLRILHEVGVKYSSSKALDILEAKGAHIDRENKVARITQAMVEDALSTAPKKFVLGARNPEFDFALPSDFTGYTLDGTGVNIIDFETGERRVAVTQDLWDSLRVFEELELGSVVWPPFSISDMPSNSEAVRSILTSMIATSKHIQHELHHVSQIPFLIEGLQAILGSEEAIRERKIFSVTYCPVAPLVHEADMLETYMELTKYHVPILAYPMPACGSTGPASMFSNIALANAEALSCLVVFQAVTPGTPIIFGDASGVISFKSGLFLEGAPEMALQTGAMGDMARYYDLPNTSAGCLSDAKEPGAQTVLEKMLTTMPLVLSGTDVINGIGMFEASMTLSLEQLVIDHEIAMVCKRIADGIDFSPEKHLFNDIVKVGQGGHFLSAVSTRKAARSGEFFRPQLLDRNSFDIWLQLGKPDMQSKAREKVAEYLMKCQVYPMEKETAEKLDEIMARADMAL